MAGADAHRAAVQAHRMSPLAARLWFRGSATSRARSNEGDQRRQFFGGRVAFDDSQQWGCGRVNWRRDACVAHSGMFPCFLGGSDSRLVASRRSALTTSARVVDGLMTPSM